jgi:hypothetical protein
LRWNGQPPEWLQSAAALLQVPETDDKLALPSCGKSITVAAPMRAFLRFSLLAIVVVCLVAGLGLGGVAWYVMRKLGPDFWVALIEKDTNCRAHIDSAHLSLFTSPAKLKLQGVRLAPRDAEVAKPFAQRMPLTDAESPIVIPQADMEVRLEDLMNKRLNILRLHLVKPVVREQLDESGRSSLELLFNSEAEVVITAPPPLPQSLPPSEVPRALPVAPAAPVAAEPAPPEPGTEDPSAFSFAMASASVEEGQLSIVSPKSTVSITDFNLAIVGFDVNRPANATATVKFTTSAEIIVNGEARIGGVKQPAQIAHLILSGEGEVANADPQGREWHPNTRLTLTLSKGSVLGGHVTMGDAAGREIRKLQEYGVDLTPVHIGGPLLADAVVMGTFADNQFTLTAPAMFQFPEYELSLAPNSWLNSSKDQHAMRLQLSCGPELQQRLERGVAEAKLGESIARAVTKALSDERGRMTFDIISSGSLSNPEVKPSIDRLLNNLLRGQGLDDLLKGLLKKL